MRPVSQPVAVGGRFVVYVTDRHRLMIVGLDARSGKVAWVHQATPSGTTLGVGPVVLAIDKRVIFMKPVGGPIARLVEVDARSGRFVWKSQPVLFGEWPHACVRDPRGACETGSSASELFSNSRLLRFRVSDGRATVGSVFHGSFGSARAISSGLVDPGLRDPEYLAAASATRVLWRRRLASIFDLGGASTDNGWDIGRLERVGLFVGSVDAPAKTRRGVSVFDLSDAETVGFRIANGSVVWSNAGSEFACGFMPCPGWPSPGGPRVGVRLRETGTVRYPARGGHVTVAPSDDVTLEGFGPATGHTLWTFDAGDDAPLISLTEFPPQAGATVVVLPNATGTPNLVDLASGHATPAAASVVAWCESLTGYNLGSLGRYTGAGAIFACNPEGHRVQTPRRIPSFVGPSIRGITAWSDRNQVVAAPGR